MSLTQILKDSSERLRKKLEERSSFQMSIHYAPQHTRPAITAGEEEVHIVYPGELFTLVALPGAGKTQVCEALAAAYVADYHKLQNIDTLGIHVAATEGRNCLYVDTERPHDDNFKSYTRIFYRTGTDKNDYLLDANGRITGLDYRCFVNLESLEILREELEYLCQTNAYGLIIIDGALDFVGSMNNEEECSALVKWLRSLANKMGCAIVTTLHPNKGSDAMAGHLGAMLYRYSRACLAIRNHEHDPEIKIITTSFQQGKLSHGIAEINLPFTWSYDTHMMASLPTEAAHKQRVPRQQVKAIFDTFLLAGKIWVPSVDIKKEYAEKYKKTKSTTDKHMAYALLQGWIERTGEGRQTTYKYVSDG